MGLHPAPMAWLCVLLLVVALSVPASADPVVHLVKDIHPGKAGSGIMEIVEVGGTLYFSATKELGGPISDGLGRDGLLRRLAPYDRPRALEELRVTCRRGYSP